MSMNYYRPQVGDDVRTICGEVAIVIEVGTGRSSEVVTLEHPVSGRIFKRHVDHIKPEMGSNEDLNLLYSEYDEEHDG